MDFPRSRISFRTPWIWFGSSPLVGSSRISTAGSCNSAWAIDTRWRNPFESFPIGLLATVASEHNSTTASMRPASVAPFKPRAGPEEFQEHRGVMSG